MAGIILVVGKTGAGKSTFVQWATGQNAGVGHGVVSETTETAYYTLPDESAVLVDTQGFADTRKPPVPDAEILRDIAEAFRDCVTANLKIVGFVWVVSMQERLSDNGLMEKIIGDNNMEHCVIVTTKWYDKKLMPDKYRNQKETEASMFELLESYKDQGAKYCRFHESQESALKATAELSPLTEFTPLLMQQYCHEGRQLIETEAGGILEGDVTGRIEQKRKALERTAAEQAKCRNSDPAKAARLEKKMQEIQAELDAALRDQERLNEEKAKLGRVERLKMEYELQQLLLERERLELEQERETDRLRREEEHLDYQRRRQELERQHQLERNKGFRKWTKRIVGVGGIGFTLATGGLGGPLAAATYGATHAATKVQKTFE